MSKPQDNSEQRDAWNGITGDSWSRYQDALDRMMTPVTAKLFAAAGIKTEDRVLDVGCGCGPTTIAYARLVGPNGHVTGIDISRVLLQSARERSASLGLPLTFVEADASVHSFTERFDKIVSRFGVMFFAEPVAAFANLRSALTPRGEMVFVCWRKFEENPWMGEVMAEAAKIVPVPPRPTHYVPGPFSFGDRNFLQSVLDKSGFKRMSIEGFEPALTMPGETLEERCAFYMRIGPMAGLIREATEEQRIRLQATLKSWVEKRIASGPATQGSACWLVRAS